MRNTKDEKIKRPEISHYVIPAMRSKVSKKCEDKMEYSKSQFAKEAANRRAYSLGKHESSQRRSTNTDPRRMRLDSSSSSSNPKNTTDESCKDYDSSDFEESESEIEPMNHFKIRNERNQNNLNDHWKKGGRRERPNKNDHGIENYENDTNISNKFLMKQKDYSDLKSHSNQELNSESYEKKFDRGLFYNSNIEAITEKGSVLNSAPNSDIMPHPGSSQPSVPHPDSSRPSVPDPVFSWRSVPRPVSSQPSIFQPVSSRPSAPDPDPSRPSIFYPDSSRRSVPRPVSSQPPRPLPTRLKVPRPLFSRSSVSGYVS